MISNANFEINKQKTLANIVALNENYIKNKKIRAKFCCLVNFLDFMERKMIK